MRPDQRLVLHDFFNAPDGGGRVAVILARSFEARLLAGHVDRGAFPAGYFDGVTLESLDAYGTSPPLLGFSKILQLWWAFSHLSVPSTLWTLFSGSFSPLAHKRISGRKVYYCLTPPRLLYDQKSFLMQQSPAWQRPLLRGVMAMYRWSYEKAVARMDQIITISETIRLRTKRYLGQDSLVVYPPCETATFRWISQEGYYLSTARVDTLKRVRLIVGAFMHMPEKRLVVVSGGSELSKIRKMAARVNNIQVLGWVDEENLRDLMGRCTATIYVPRDEDFGISPVESMAAGKPVIGVQEGALLETVGGCGGQKTEARGQMRDDRRPRTEDREQGSDGRGRGSAAGRGLMVTGCGVLVPRDPEVVDVMKAVSWMTPERALGMREACETRARRFDTSVFHKKMRGLLEEKNEAL